jgi:hypothetical protein
MRAGRAVFPALKNVGSNRGDPPPNLSPLSEAEG